jgi:hypothetical protein
LLSVSSAIDLFLRAITPCSAVPQPNEKKLNQHALAGESIKPRVKRSGTLGKGAEILQSPWNERQRCVSLRTLPPATRAGQSLTHVPRVPLRFTLGFMLAPAPQAR